MIAFAQSKSSQEYEDKRRKEGFFTKVANVLNDLKTCDFIIVVLLKYDIDSKVNEKITLLTKVYKAVCQSMGEENINKLVRRSIQYILPLPYHDCR